MRTRDIMTSPVVTVTPDTSLKDVAALLVERAINAVPVVDAGDRLCGSCPRPTCSPSKPAACAARGRAPWRPHGPRGDEPVRLHPGRGHRRGRRRPDDAAPRPQVGPGGRRRPGGRDRRLPRALVPAATRTSAPSSREPPQGGDRAPATGADRGRRRRRHRRRGRRPRPPLVVGLARTVPGVVDVRPGDATGRVGR